MTSGDYPNNPDPTIPPQPGAYPPPPPPPPPQYGQAGAYPPPPPPYGQPEYGQPHYGQPEYGQPHYGQPEYGQPGGYPPPGYGPVGGQEPGGLGLRFAARLLDGLIVGIVAFLLALVIGAYDNILVTGVFSGVLTFAYFVVFEVTQGWTPAKKALGLSVRGPGGAPKPDAKQSAIRNSFTLLSVIPYIGGLLAFVAYIVIAVTINGSPTKQGKHDVLAGGTQVVKG